MDQVEVGTTSTIRARFAAGSDVRALDSVTVTITHWDGSPLVTDGAATAGDECWDYLLTPLDDVDRLTAVWTGTKDADTYIVTSTVDVVGGFYFDLYDLGQQPGLVNSGTSYLERLVPGRHYVEAAIDSLAGTSFVERFREETVDREHGQLLLGHRHHNLSHRWITLEDNWPRRVLGVTVDGTPLSSDDLALLTVSEGDLAPVSRSWPAALQGRWSHATVQYVGGYSTKPTEDLSIASMLRAVDHITSTYGGVDSSTQILVEDDKVICSWIDRVRLPAMA